MWKRTACGCLGLLFGLVFLAPPAALAQKAGSPAATVEGTVMVDGNTVTLKHVYSRLEKVDGTDLPAVLFSDQPLSAEALASKDPWEPFDSLAREGQAHTVRVRFDAKGDILKVWIHDAAFDGALQTPFPGTFEKTRFDHQGVEGKMVMPKPEQFFKHRWQLNARFKVAMPAR